MSGKPQKMEFQAESRQLLDMMIHSIYSNKEIFLRELISNASDAMDRLRIESLTDSSVAEAMKDSKLEIRLESDTAARTLTIRDSGIGMSHKEVIDNIGTIARSGTKELIEKLKQSGGKSDADLIGQFGVGFYSSFMVAEKVTITTRRAGDSKATLWESTGDGTYTITETDKDTFGTEIVLTLKPSDPDNGIEDYTDPNIVTDIVKRYSDFINYPIVMKKEIVKDDKKTILEDVTLNSMKPIWARPASEVTDEDYHQFYRHVSHDWQDPLKVITYKAEGAIEYSSLLFIPSQAPFDLYYQGYKSGLQLYVRRVKIVDDFEDLLPHYLRFVKGVVESADLPLNISREILQQDRQIVQMRKSLTKKVLSTLAEMLDKDRETYIKFWGQFGAAMKEGVTTDNDNKDKLTDLILFRSSESADDKALTTIREYAGRMKPGQEHIFYMTGDTVDIIKNSPHLEIFREKGYEVLYLTDPVDEIVITALNEFDGKKLKSVEKGEFDLGADKEKKESKKKLEEKTKEYEGFLDLLKDSLKERVKDVRLTNRLVTAPACLVGDEQDMSPHLEKLLKRANMGVNGYLTKRILELNPSHPIVAKLHEKFDASKDDPALKDAGELLVEYAQISEGGEIQNPMRFNELLLKLMEKGL